MILLNVDYVPIPVLKDAVAVELDRFITLSVLVFTHICVIERKEHQPDDDNDYVMKFTDIEQVRKERSKRG